MGPAAHQAVRGAEMLRRQTRGPRRQPRLQGPGSPRTCSRRRCRRRWDWPHRGWHRQPWGILHFLNQCSREEEIWLHSLVRIIADNKVKACGRARGRNGILGKYRGTWYCDKASLTFPVNDFCKRESRGYFIKN
jgi:hypothetical protein